MDSSLLALLERIHEDGLRHDAAHEDRIERRRNVEPETARMLGVLVRAARAGRLLELGTSNGYSTIWLADAARDVGGTLRSVELDSERLGEANLNLKEAGLRDLVDLRQQDAGACLAASPDEIWDFIFLDAERPSYAGYWPDLLRSLSTGGLLAIDNVLSHAEELADVRRLIESDERVMAALAPVGAGVLLVVKR